MTDTFSDPHLAWFCRQLNANKLTNPLTGKPYDEAWLLGLSSGLGAGYILYEFAKDNSAHLVLNLRYRWNYPLERLQKAADRTGLNLTVQETTSPTKGQQLLNDALADGIQPLVFLDWLHTPYFWATEAVSQTDQGIMARDVGAAYSIDADRLASCRAVTPSTKNRIILATAGKKPSKKQAQENLRAALADCADYLLAKSDSFSIKAWQKWARMMTDEKNKKGWPSVLGDGTRLAEPLFLLHDRILYTAADGAGLRSLYADFLEQADGCLPAIDLTAAKDAYREAARALTTLADTALPKDIAEFKEARKIMKHRHKALVKGGDKAIKAIEKDNRSLADLRDNINQNKPLSASDRTDLFQDIQTALVDVVEKETAAATALRDAL